MPTNEVKILKIKFKRLGPNVCHSERKSGTTVGYNISAVEFKIIQHWKQELISTQIMLAIPHGAYERIALQSGLAIKEINVRAGIIDSDYRGELKVLLINHSDIQFEVKKGDWIAQLIVKKISLEELNERNSLNDIEQGDKGFGSMGIAETLKIQILKRPKMAKIAESPKAILPEKVDKWSSHKETKLVKIAELSKSRTMMIFHGKGGQAI